jgi:hypothetical protein
MIFYAMTVPSLVKDERYGEGGVKGQLKVFADLSTGKT